ncbi:MAG TPA: septation protein SpoVG family protein [Candidatus Omnitrophota bacterium]|nr:septation protein SpoVG family protein [Candidatus Omnitrophota bacterium]HSA30703.1 septation protein SpoVG family protein [Candidatus Omnitrophota bacterium]
MKITEVRVFSKEGQDKKLKAYATVTFDGAFVIRNIKIIQGSTGMFIAMPSRKMKTPCPRCSFKNEVGSKYCNQCGAELKPASEEDLARDAKAEHRDIAHPITQEFRDYLQSEVLKAYEAENPADK